MPETAAPDFYDMESLLTDDERHVRDAAAKFVNGPGGDSGWGAVPEPSTALLVACGLVGLAVRRKRAA